ncbi:hypothetical protein C8R44DRAFT_326041 [Mycena epipterygia]|nr:hypothetical protein C8R44DRAFT_326041 [Mycena epipterygia]
MQILSVISLLSALIVAALAAPISSKASPTANSAAITPTTTAAEASSTPHSGSTAEGQDGDIFEPLDLTLPHLGIEDEAHPKKPLPDCVIA